MSLCLLLLLQGCCGILVGVFGCGAGSPLVAVGWDSPVDSMRTLKAAIRHGDARVIYECLSEEFKQRNGIDGLAFAVAWERLQSEVPGIVLAGEAEIIDQQAPDPDTRSYLLETHGYRFRIVLVARAYSEFGRRSSNDETIVEGEYVSDLGSVIVFDDDAGKLTTIVKSPALIGRDRRDIAFVRAGRQWKVRTLRREEEESK